VTIEPNRHAESLLPSTERLLAQAGVDKRDLRLIAVGIGPGSYTGLRVGIALATGLGMGLAIPVVGIPSLTILAHALARRLPSNPNDETPRAVGAILDARRGESFFAAFDATMETLIAPCIVPNAELADFVGTALSGRRVLVAGADVGLHFPESMLPSPSLRELDSLSFPTAAEVTLLASSKHAQPDPLPFYLREADAKLPNLPQNPLAGVD
jgi:tRNA threonylcarbamoyl adenosine modification protein YeaZ